VAGLPHPVMNGFSVLKRFIAMPERQNGAKMTEDKRAELYTNPGGKFIRADWRIGARFEQPRSRTTS
jgi:hypothetical protein